MLCTDVGSLQPVAGQSMTAVNRPAACIALR